MNMNGVSAPVLEKSWDKVPGHLMPATAFICVGSFALVRSLQLAKELPPGKSFTQTHIPYRNLDVVRNIGMAVMAVTTVGAIYHSLGEGIDTSIRLHMTLYAGFFMVGLVTYLESQGRLMPDSGRASLALAYLLNGIVWQAHGAMMAVPVNQTVHLYESYINMASAVTMAYSVMRKDSILAHIISWALMVLQGFWLYFISVYLCCINVEEGMVEADLCMIVLAMTICIVLAIAYSDLPQLRESHVASDSLMDGRGEYEVLAKFHNHLEANSSGGSETTVESQDSGDEQC